MRTARLRVVPGGGEREGGVVTMSQVGGGGWVLWPCPRWGEGGRCCDHVPGGGGGGGRRVLWPCPRWGGGGRCCDHVPGGGVGRGRVLWTCPRWGEGAGVVTMSQVGGWVLWPFPGGRGGGCCDLVAHLPPGLEVTHACENITFARFATWAVKNNQVFHRTKVHWVPLTTSTWIQRAKNLVSSWHHLIDHNVKMFSYNEHPATTSTFLCIKMLVVSGTQCIFRKTTQRISISTNADKC